MLIVATCYVLISNLYFQNPAVLAAMQNGLGKLVGQVLRSVCVEVKPWTFFQSSGYVASLPAPVRRRIKALKKLQMESTNIEAKFYEEVFHHNGGVEALQQL